MQTNKHLPRLSIGILFRDNIRSIERCLKALQPLREAVPCQLIMADTGSEDGSREIAERYADILIDFPWINDFAAARNALIDLADGEWFLTVDSDEYLDEDFSQLITFLDADVPAHIATGSVTQRNFRTLDFDGAYTDFLAQRLCRLSAGLRYYGAIHEALAADTIKDMVVLPQVVLNHDGYVNLNAKEGNAKRERNITLLREELEQDPDNLRRLLQYIESGSKEQDYLTCLYHSVALVENEHLAWNIYGASIMRHAVMAAHARQLPELEHWIDFANEKFPNSYFTRLDVDYVTLLMYFDKKKYEECVCLGERLLRAHADYKKGGLEAIKGQTVGSITTSPPVYRESVRVMLAKAYLETEEPERSIRVLGDVDCTRNGFEEQEVLNLANILMELQSRTYLDTAGIIRHCWDSLTAPVPSEKAAEKRRGTFLGVASATFDPFYRAELETKEGFCRQTYTAFLPLAECELGVAAAMLETEDPAELEALLRRVEKWGELPVSALAHALGYIPAFPLPDRPLQMEEMDGIAQRLGTPAEHIRKLALGAVEEGLSGSWQQLNWTRALVLSAVRAWPWKEEKMDPEKGLELARCFVRLEKAFLPRFYAGEVLEEANVSALPPMHRFGWYCIRALDALDAGDPAGYARFLREGLAVNRGMKPLVEFLTEHTPEIQVLPQEDATAELSALAEQVRAILAGLDPDDPAVAQLKESPVYRQVAWMLEDGAPHTFVNLPQ